VKITTDHKPREIIDAAQLTEAERAEFDYLNWRAIDAGTDSASFFRYKGAVYDLGCFMRAPESLRPWDGYTSDSAFSGLVVRYANDNEDIIVGWYMT
jgi:hypothetical protein